MNTILVPVDFSPITRQVIREAVALAHAMRGRILLFHSVSPLNIDATDFVAVPGTSRRLGDDLLHGARRRLQRLRQNVRKQQVEVELLVTDGPPPARILETAKAREVAFIVLGSHGHTALYDVVVGSTTKDVLKGATCPVVVVPPPEKRLARRAVKRVREPVAHLG